MTEPMIGGDLFWRILSEQGISFAFGLPGTQNVPLYESLRHAQLKSVLTSDETSATFAANGYFRASGKIAVVLAIPGPGFTRTLSGVAEALHDSCGLILVTVSPATDTGHKFALQAIDQKSISAPLFKKQIHIDQEETFTDRILEGISAAGSGEPGPVLIDIDARLLNSRISYEPELQQQSRPTSPPEIPPEIITRLLRSQRAICILGQGAAVAAQAIQELAEQNRMAVFTSCSGRGVLSESHPLSICGDMSAADVLILNELINQSDLVLALGIKFSHNGSVGFDLKIDRKKLIHVDSSEGSLNANYPADIALQADLAEFAPQLLKATKDQANPKNGWTDQQLQQYKSRISQSRTVACAPKIDIPDRTTWQEFFLSLSDSLTKESIVVTDSGMHQMLARAFMKVTSPRGFIAPSDFQSMGFGMPAAIGAKLAAPERELILICGDGGFNMAAPEIATAVRLQLNMIIMIFNDGKLGLIRRQQLRDYGHEISVTTNNPDYQHLAKAYGAHYHWLAGDLEALLATCRNQPGVHLVEIPLKDGWQLRRHRSSRLIKNSIRAIIPKRRA